MSELPRVGLVISTFAAVPYVHLHLEVISRHKSELSVLVHDDCSSKQRELEELCRYYGASFLRNEKDLHWVAGGYSAIPYGLQWAQKQGLDLLVRMSRRFIPLFDWVPGLQKLHLEQSAATYSNRCQTPIFWFDIRSECMAMSVPKWMSIADLMLEDLAKNLDAINREVGEARTFRMVCKVSPSGFVKWEEMLGENRLLRDPKVLFHDYDGPDEFYRVSCALGLGYGLKDFADPHLWTDESECKERGW